MRQSICFLLLFFWLWLPTPPAYANNNIALITRGVARTLFSVFELPKDLITSGTQAFPLGIVAGALSGTMKTVAGTVMGAADIARGAAPYAKYAIFAI